MLQYLFKLLQKFCSSVKSSTCISNTLQAAQHKHILLKANCSSFVLWTVGLLQAAFLSFLQVHNSAIKHDYNEIKLFHSESTMHILMIPYPKYPCYGFDVSSNFAYFHNAVLNRLTILGRPERMNNFVVACTCTLVKVIEAQAL